MQYIHIDEHLLGTWWYGVSGICMNFEGFSSCGKLICIYSTVIINCACLASFIVRFVEKASSF